MNQLRLIGFLVVLGVAVASWVVTCGTWQLEKVAEGVVPLDARRFPALTVVTVGTGGAYENPERSGPATAVGLGDDVVLVDAGRAVAEGLRRARLPASQPHTLLLTSLLPENTVGLDDLLVNGWLDGRSAPLRVYGPPGTAALADAVAASQRRGIEARAEALGMGTQGAAIEARELAEGWSEQIGQLRVRAGALPGGPLESFAYRFEAQDRSVVVGGGGWAPDALVAFARGAHLLVHEASAVPPPELGPDLGVEPERLRREAALHTQLDDVGGLAARAGVEKLALVRLRPPPVYDLQFTRLVGGSFSGQVLIPDDGDEIRP